MSLNVDINKSRLLISVSGDMTIPVLADIREAVMDNISKARRIDFDLSRVEDIDSAAFQLLLAVKKMAESSDISMTISAASSAVRDCMDTYRTGNHFGMNND